MKFKKLALGLTVAVSVNASAPTIKVFANEVNTNIKNNDSIEENINNTEAKVTPFDFFDNEGYNEIFRMNNSNIQQVNSKTGHNVGKYLDYATDNNINTAWESKTVNSTTFKNELEFIFEEKVTLDRVIYGARQTDSKGFAKEFEIYGSTTSDGDNYELVSTGKYNPTKGLIEAKFAPTEFKRLKFKFIESKDNWATVSEIAFYTEDKVKNSIDRLFTDENKNIVSEEFNSIEKLEKLENEAKDHPAYSDFKESINDAKILLENKDIEASEAEVTRFDLYDNEEYNTLFKMNESNVESITNNSGQYASQKIQHAVDGNVNTYWETGKSNSDSFKTEIEITLKERVVLDRIVYGARQSDLKGFVNEFEIYGSNTSEGDTYQLVATGSHNRVSGLVEAKFNPTEFKRIKFKAVNANQNWPTINEFVFYKQDEVADKMDRLFTDENRTMVSEEFNSVEKIEALELEVKEHPLYNDFKEDLNDAKILVNSGDIVASVAETKFFQYLDNEKYHEEFRVPKSNIKGISNNGGHYASQSIDKAIDYDVNTYWETRSSNTETWKNEVIIELNEREVIDKVVYGARPDSKGSAHNMEILVSNTNTGDNFELLTVSNYNHTNKLVEANFEPTEVKRVKFRYVGAKENWATATEFWLYKEDKLSNEVESVFADNLQTILNDKYDTIDELLALESQVATHPLKEEFQVTIDDAKKLINNNGQVEGTTQIVRQDGNMAHHAKNVLKMKRAGQDFEVTGYYAQPGDVIEVFLDVESTSKMPVLQFSQNVGSRKGWRTGVVLQPGKNIIEVPTVPNQQDGTKPGGAIYINNPFTAEEQGYAPKIRIVGADKYPVYKEGDNVEEFKAFLAEYKEKLDADNAAGGDKVLDIMDFESERMLFAGTTTGAYNAYIRDGGDPLEVANFWNDTMEEIFRFHGLDGSSPENDPKALKEHIRLMQPHGAMYAGSDHVGVQGNYMEAFHKTNPQGWGIIHEIGHRTDLSQREYTEITNNMLSLHMAKYWDVTPGNRVPYNYVYAEAVKEEPADFNERGYFGGLGVFWQLEVYSPGYWGKVDALFRKQSVSMPNQQAKRDAIIRYACEAIGEDVTDYFERVGFNASAELDQQMKSQYPALTKKVWYLNDNAYSYKGDGIQSNATVEVDSVKHNGEITINSNIPKEDLLGYEILKDGKIVGFTASNTFIDPNADNTKESKYSAIAYGYDLSVSEESIEQSSFAPSIQQQQQVLTIGLGDEFNAMDYVNAKDKDGNSLNDNIEIVTDLDVNKKGEYTVTYNVTSNNITTTKTMKVIVSSDIHYLSDKEWDNVETQYGTPRRNTNIKVRLQEEVKEFDKGFGIHANGKIEYDLGENHNYDTFEAYLGVDMGLVSQDRSSITFKIVGDGKTLATTNVLKHADNAVAINIPITGVQNLSIEIHDGGNGNSSDHAVIAEPKLSINNTKPKLEVPKDLIAKVGEMNIGEILGEVKATDIEDGDLTDKVVIKGADKINPNRYGKHELVYSVTDADGNTVEKTRNVTIYSESEYASDVEWESATTGWKDVNKDKAVGSTNKIKLKVDGVVKEFDKGIGVSTNSEIVYDLRGKDFTAFSTYLGTDKNYDLDETSIDFTIYADDKLVYESDTIRKDSNAEFVNIDLEGVNELRLVADDHDGNGVGDFVSYGDAKFYKVNSKPTLEIEEDLLVKAGEMSLSEILGEVKATDIEDGDLKDKVVIKGADQVNPNRYGKHELIYSVTDIDGNTVEKTRTVTIYSGSEYASDVEWESATTGWKDVNKDKAVGSTNKIKLKVDGVVKEFDKGIGVATNSEIVYDLRGKDFTAFSAYIGTDKNYDLDQTSIDFSIYADDKLVYESDTIRKDSDAEFVNIDLEGVSELRLVADNHDGNGVGDFVSYGDAKFYKVNSKPTLEIEKSVSTVVGESIENIIGTYSSNDLEDGDLSDKVKVTGHENINFNKPGEYEITYSVSDSEGNTTTKTRTIAVVDMRDSNYLTEYDWKSAVQSYGSTKKDTSANGNNIRLTVENGEEIVYDRGIGAHANSTVIYDLSEKNYEYFTSYVGVDRNMYGSVASVSFEVYVDGEKKFDSGLMNSRDSQKFVNVNITDAKELKLVVTDGGNGIGSDHASWGDTKLHYANSERADLTDLESLIEETSKIDTSIYEEEKVAELNKVLDEATNLVNQEGLVIQSQVDTMIEKINQAVDNLVDLTEVVNIPDDSLRRDILNQLGKNENHTLTLGDMHSLKELTLHSWYVNDLTGIDKAVNLEYLDISNNEITDISLVSKLKKLKTFKGLDNFILSSNIDEEGDNYVIEPNIIDVDGSALLPYKINIGNEEINVADVLDGNRIVISKELVGDARRLDVVIKSKTLEYEINLAYLLI